MKSIQYHKYPTLHYITEVEAKKLAVKYCNNKQEKDNSNKGMKNASKKNAGIVVEESISCCQTPQSSKKDEEKNKKQFQQLDEEGIINRRQK